MADTVGDRDIYLFAGGSGGYGWAVNPGADVYHWAINMDCRNGRADLVPGPASFGNQTLTSRPSTIIEWEDSSGVPLLLIPHGLKLVSRVVNIKDGATTLEDDGGVLFEYKGGVLYRHDGSDADVAMVYLCFGTSAVIRQRNIAGTYSSAGHDAKADTLWVVGGDLWRVVDGYKLEKLIIATDPGLDASWGPVKTPAGRPTYDINAVLDFGGSPLVFKGEGVFRYNSAPTVATFENLTPFIPAHPDNGKGGFGDGRGRFYYPTITGRILVISFGSQSQQGPLRFQEIDRNTPFGRISLMEADEEFVYALIDPGFVKTQQIGLVMKVDDGGVFTTHTTNVTDQKKATTENAVAGLANSGSDYVYFGSDEPFWGVYIELLQASTLSGVQSWTAQYSTGSGWTTFTAQDSTLSFRQDGAITLDPTADVFAAGLWKTQTVDSQADKYWIRLTPTTSLTTTRIAEVYLIPYRPSYDTTNFPEIGAAFAHALPKVIVGRWAGQHIVWYDWVTFLSSSPLVMTVSRTKGTNSVGEQTMHFHVESAVFSVPIGPDADPVRASWPATNGILHAIGFSGHTFDAPVNVKSVQKLVLHGEFLQSDDALHVYHRYDNADRWEHDGAFSQFPIVLNNLASKGRVLHVAVQLTDTSLDAVAPYISHAIVPKGEWIDHGPLEENVGADIAAPQVV